MTYFIFSEVVLLTDVHTRLMVKLTTYYQRKMQITCIVMFEVDGNVVALHWMSRTCPCQRSSWIGSLPSHVQVRLRKAEDATK
jgi:hypothetical protein